MDFWNILLGWFIISIVIYGVTPLLILMFEETDTSLSLQQLDNINNKRESKLFALCAVLGLPLTLIVLLILWIRYFLE